jgi:arylformamidase
MENDECDEPDLSAADWRRYDREQLNFKYIVRRQVADWADYLSRWKSQSTDVRARYGRHLDIRYGAHEAETLDLFLPERPADGVPVQILFHGGFWRALHKDEYAFVAAPGLERGIAAVVVNYALCPTVSMTELVMQCRRAVEWTATNVGSLTGSAANLYLSGHSAGAHLVASMLATDWSSFNLPRPPSVRAACAVSGLYDLAPMRCIDIKDDLKLTEDEVEALSPIHQPIYLRPPMLLATGALESSEFTRQTALYAARAKTAGVTVNSVQVPDRHHYSVLDALADPQHSLCRCWLETVVRTAVV